MLFEIDIKLTCISIIYKFSVKRNNQIVSRVGINFLKVDLIHKEKKTFLPSLNFAECSYTPTYLFVYFFLSLFHHVSIIK